MALIFADGFDRYAAVGDSPRACMREAGWIVQGSSIEADANTVSGVGQSVRLYANQLSRPIGKVGEAIVGFGYYYSAAHNDTVLTFRFNPLFDGSDVQDMLRVKINTLGGLTVEIVDPSRVADSVFSDVNLFYPDSWSYIEALYKPDDIAGTIIVKVNGAEVINFTGRTRGTRRPNYVTDIALPHNVGEYSGLVYAYYDNLYVLDTTGSAPLNDFLGQVALIGTLLQADITPNDWTPSAGTSHVALVTETIADDDASYLEDDTVGHGERFSIGALPSNITAVLAVGTKLRAKKSAPGERNVRVVAKLAGTYRNGAVGITQADYTFLPTWMPLDPSDAAWTALNVESTEWGFKVAP